MKPLAAALLVVAFLQCATMKAQDAKPGPMRSVYVEYFGTGGLYSLNYEYRIRSAAFRIGGEAMNMFANNYNDDRSLMTAMPISLLLLTNPNAGRTMEVGVGYTPTWGARGYDRNEGTRKPADLVEYDYDGFPTVQIGYRWQPRQDALLFRADLTLLYLSEVHDARGGYKSSFLQPWFGLSLGYTFKGRSKE